LLLEAASRKVLVIESDEVILVLISYLLTRESYLVHTTLNAADAEQMLAAETYDAILLELRVPTGGVELIHRIAENDPKQLEKIIVVTSAIQEATRLAGLPLHAIIRKPFEVTALVETVRSLVEPA
jgi:DNA-binding response OmpR family regulator